MNIEEALAEILYFSEQTPGNKLDSNSQNDHVSSESYDELSDFFMDDQVNK